MSSGKSRTLAVHRPVTPPSIGAQLIYKSLDMHSIPCYLWHKNIGTVAALVATRKSKTVLNFNYAKEST